MVAAGPSSPSFLSSLLLLGLLVSFRATLAQQFDVREATIDDVHEALFTGATTCRQVVSAFLSRIEELNPIVNAIISLDPSALGTADDLDVRIASGNVTSSPLFCIPVLLKDNFDAAGTNTTGGCAALAGNRAEVDAPTVKALRNAGAIILGKANMHEMALEGISVSSLGGQVINPYDRSRTPGGSSGGSGAAIASNFAVLATGTDTVNSLRSPASANSLYSFRPTRGLISRARVIPVSWTQDAVGAMGRTVNDIAVALTVMAGIGYDWDDIATNTIPPEVLGRDYAEEASRGVLKGLRLGVLNGFFNHTESDETTPVNDALATMMSVLEAEDATLVNITDPVYNTTAVLAERDVQRWEYRGELNHYLSLPNLTGSRPASFEELYSRVADSSFLVLPYQQEYITTAFHASTSNDTWFIRQRRIDDLRNALLATFSTHSLDAVIYPQQKNLVVKIGSPSQSGRNGILAALTGVPVVTVPAGFSPPSAEAPRGVPIGMEILGLPWSEGKLLGIAQRLSEAAPVRRMPAYTNMSVETRAYSAVPSVVPNNRNIPAAYLIPNLVTT